MTPEQRITQLENTVQQLVAFVNSLENVGQFPQEVEGAIRARLFGESLITSTTGKQTVVENGASTYDVTIAPNDFFTIKDSNGRVRNVASYLI